MDRCRPGRGARRWLASRAGGNTLALFPDGLTRDPEVGRVRRTRPRDHGTEAMERTACETSIGMSAPIGSTAAFSLRTSCPEDHGGRGGSPDEHPVHRHAGAVSGVTSRARPGTRGRPSSVSGRAPVRAPIGSPQPRLDEEPRLAVADRPEVDLTPGLVAQVTELEIAEPDVGPAFHGLQQVARALEGAVVGGFGREWIAV